MKKFLKKLIKPLIPHGIICLRNRKKVIPENHKENQPSEILIQNKNRSLYKTKYGDLFWLKENAYIDECIKADGIFEAESTNFVRDFLKPGNIAFDIGANIGYYSVIMSKIVHGGGIFV